MRMSHKQGFLGVPVVKNPPASAGDVQDTSSVPGSGRSPGGGHGNPLQYSFLENPHGQKGYGPGGHKESDMTERLSTAHTSVAARSYVRYLTSQSFNFFICKREIILPT